MTLWIWMINFSVLLLWGFSFYRMKMKWIYKRVLLTPILIYVLISVEDLLNWIDWGTIVPGN